MAHPPSTFGDLHVDSAWHVWHPSDPPIPHKHPLNESITSCFDDNSEALKVSNRSARLPMCLTGARGPVAATLRRFNRLDDCSSIVCKNGCPKIALLLDIGANVGACTVEWLLKSRMTVFSFEPNPLNLFYLTRTLHAGQEQLKNCRGNRTAIAREGCVTVLPIAVGSVAGVAPVLTDELNPGNSRLVAQGTAHPDQLQTQVPVRPLDELFPNGLPASPAALKIDAQGFECNILKGAQRLLASGQIVYVKTEVSEWHLKQNNCSKQGLLKLLTDAGYDVRFEQALWTRSAAYGEFLATWKSAAHARGVERARSTRR